MLSWREWNNWGWATFGSANGRTWLILSCFLPITKVFKPAVNTFSAHGFRPVHLHQHLSPSPFSLICNRTWCLLVAPLHCDRTSHIDYVQLPAASLPWWSCVLYARWRFMVYLWIAMCMRTHLAHVAFELSDHSPNFLDTPHILQD
jgi:hypothetical protein